MPSINTLTLPSGSGRFCRTLATTPVSFKSACAGLSVAASFCRERKSLLSVVFAICSAFTERGLPTKIGVII